jgi:hypothetical protein
MNISHLRLVNHHIAKPQFNNVKDIVGWMGAMQAQDYNMAKWAIGSRLTQADDMLIESAIENVEIIRTHVLRPTWHFVSANDIYWMLELSAPQIKAFTKSRDNSLGITESLFNKSNELFLKILSGGKRLTRSELIAEFNANKIENDENRFYHYLMRAEIDGIIFSRSNGPNKQKYSILSESLPKTKTFSRDEALLNLAKKYFTSHGPATVLDFSWWSGLSVRESKRALEMALPDLLTETVNGCSVYFSSSPNASSEGDTVHFVAAFDEFLISYKDRTSSISLEHQSKAFTSNGIFRPIVVVNGQVVGIWTQSAKKDKVVLKTDFFGQVDKKIYEKISNATKPLSYFLQKHVEIA